MMNDCPVDIDKLTPIEYIKGDSTADTVLLRNMATEALDFISTKEWCSHVDQGYWAFGIGGVVAVLLFQIVPRFDDIDSYLWVIVGDIPSAYIVADENPTAKDALDAYCSEMEAWVEAVEQGASVKELIPVNAPATHEYAEQLKGRIKFLREKIIPLSE